MLHLLEDQKCNCLFPWANRHRGNFFVSDIVHFECRLISKMARIFRQLSIDHDANFVNAFIKPRNLIL